MTPGWRKYAEPRLYLTALSVGMLAIVWSVLFAQDHRASSEEGAEAAPEARRTATREQAVAPQTRTRGS
jgi:hypothetical protein